jgi:starch synthase
MEALASGTPLIATRVGGIPSVVVHQRTGWLVPERDAAALAGALDRLLRDRETRLALGRAAREDALGRRTWATVAAAFERVYDLAACRAEDRRARV